MEKEFNILALICARGGSKGIPNKNIREFHGKPILGWVIEAAKCSRALDRIIVSTDNQKISDVAIKYGAEIPGLRPSSLAQDNSNQFDTHAYIFDKLNISDDNSRVCILMNNPFLSANLVQRMVNKAEDSRYERLVTTITQTHIPYYFQIKCKDGIAFPQFKDEYVKTPINRQNRESVYFPFFLGCVGKPSMLKSWEAYKAEVVRGFIPVVLNKNETFDLDDEEDWQIAEALFDTFHNK